MNASPVAIYGALRLLVYTLLMNTILDYTVTNIAGRGSDSVQYLAITMSLTKPHYSKPV